MQETTSPLASRLRQSREKVGQTLESVAKKIGIGASTISDFENAKREPSLSQLSKLAANYRQTITFFLDESPLVRPSVLWRKRPERSRAEELEESFFRLAEQYHLLESWCGEPTPEALPEPDTTFQKTFTRANAERLAHKVRADLGLGERPSDGLRRVLEERCGVKVFHLDFGHSGPAACVRARDMGSAIFLNTSTNGRSRWSFDLAHELFHLMTWEHFGHHSRNEASYDILPEETWADAFAESLLMPDESFKDAVNRRLRNNVWEYEDLLAVAREFGVSYEAMLWRIKNLHLAEISPTEIKPIAQKFREIATRVEPQEHGEEPPVRPARFEALARRALERGDISTGKYAEFMGISRHEAMKVSADVAHKQEKAHGRETLQASFA